MSEVVVWFDGGCPLCRREIALMHRLDRRQAITFLDVDDGTIACPLDRGEMLARFHASENGEVLSGAAAFAAMWRAIPALRPLGLLARAPGVLPVLEGLYRLFLKARPAMQGLARRLESEGSRP